MPDSRAREPLPRDWGDAFGGLPLETPPEGAWQRVAIALPPAPAPHRTRWRRPALALAATAFFAAVVPLLHWRTTVDSPLSSQPAPLPEIATSAPLVATPEPLARASIAAEAQDAYTSARSAPASRARQTPERALRARQHDPARLDALYTESARLEAVLAQLPDSTVGNVAILAVSADLQDQVAHIDLALSQPALQESARAALWQQRVDTLRQLTGVEATQRWQVALNDTSADTAIY
ncbi:hypothetical protein [Pseudoxanthomonas mexicana]|uniref:hypothetical protein n=1 Tax=Pseudoxanthomonas mexicana TaxID=128785 RepID=UPI001FD6B3A1|nr:hypothetical protein [Pseudoxanthomonas mexicana]UOV00765.1 hypothetical protein MUU73_12255 [Pseudoxanthomonas mexicana]